jgi:peptidyl-prolyl cis-trans isomerase A (cyclophilin A)
MVSQAADQAPATDASATSKDDFVPPEGLSEGWYARIETSMGRVLVRLLPEQSPQSVAHFVGMAEGTLEWFDIVSGQRKKEPYYDGLIVHSAVAGRRFETGDHMGTGDGAPELFVGPEGRGPIDFSHAGRLGMTRELGARVSAVQFFVTAAPLPHLTGSHPCFGEVIEGKETVFSITQVKTYPNSKPIDPPVIEKIRIFTVGDPAPLATPAPYTPRLHKLRPREGLRDDAMTPRKND